ncbi:MAG TPA: hypothetical protein VFU47_08575, partial [Armatimonadota bacterium]|nr:hypothetical protein [Armatimonadota bacterium]
MFAGMGGLFLGGLLSTFLSLYFMCGMERTAAKQLRGEPIAVGDLFTAGDVYLPALGATIITGFLVTVGAIFCYVPGLLLAGMFSLVIPIIVEERVGVMEAIGKSWEATKPHMWMYLVWYLLISLILSLGASVCYIGMVATIPIYSIAMMVAYRDVFGIPGAVAPAAAVPIVPTASYGPAGPPVAASACPACHRPVAAGAVVCPYCSAPLTGGPQQPGLPPHA